MEPYSSQRLHPDQPHIDLVKFIRNELRRAYEKNLLEGTGHLIYGVGNFEVYVGDDGEWQIRPVEGWKPAELQGILTDENRKEE